MSDRNDAVGTRLHQLEKSNRRMKMIGLAALALFGMAATQNHSNVLDLVQAKRFQVVDNHGNVLADLGPFGNKNHANLVVYDSKGVVRAGIGIDPNSDNSGDAGYDRKGILRTFSGAVETGSLHGLSGHFTYDQQGMERIAINVDPVDDFIGLANLDANGKPRVIAGTPLGARDEFLEMHDGNGTLRVGLASDYDSTGGEGLNLFDKGGFFREALSVDDSNFGGTGNEFLGFSNDVGFPGYFSAPPGGGGAYVTNNADGSARTGALPPNAP